MNTDAKQPLYIPLVLIFIQFLFGFNFITSKYSLMVMDPFGFSCVRFLIAGTSLLVISFFLKKRAYHFHKKHLFLIFLCGFTGVGLGQSLFMWGIKYSGAVNASIVSVSIPLFTLFVSFLRNQITLTQDKIIGIIGAVIGVLILKSESILHWENKSLLGDICLLMACLSLGVFISLSKDLFTDFPVTLGSALIFLVGGLLLIPLGSSYFEINRELLFQFPYLEAFLFSVFGGTLATYFLNNWVVRKVDPLKLSLFIYLQPVVAALFAYFLLGESITLYKIGASVIIFVSVLYSLK
ncbi:MAG: DMT family transporter [Halobacteriovoraceae bacterium]|nr:DMT family transporter [Halobacteriovoraceae bacterium]